MKIFRTDQVKTIDQYTIEHEPIASIDLMERAAWQCSAWIMKQFGRSHTVKIFCGCGNNGGDGLAIARQLYAHDYPIEVYLVKINDTLTIDAKSNLSLLADLSKIGCKSVTDISQLPRITDNDVVIDAIFGSGLSRVMTGLAADVVTYLNQQKATKVSIDIPSGLMGEGVAGSNTVFQANFTLTFQFPFLSFLFPENHRFVGEWKVLDIGLHREIISNLETPYQIISAHTVKLNPRPLFAHKGTFGHALIIAGSRGMAGAALLSSKACLRCGCGLVTIHTPAINAPIVQTSFPEALVSYDNENDFIAEIPDLKKYDSFAIGPGIGTNTATADVLQRLIASTKSNLVLDADALNILSTNQGMLKELPFNTIITPHPGEFDRLFGKALDSKERLDVQLTKAKELGIIIVLKGRYTSIALPNGNCYFNPTGNPGMATAGSGDVLTGMIVSLLAQGYAPAEAAVFGVYLHGMAGDMAADRLGGASLIASDIIDNISNAFLSLTK